MLNAQLFKNCFLSQVATTLIEWDFVLDKDKPSQSELQARFARCNGRDRFLKDNTPCARTNPIAPPQGGKLPLEEFEERLGYLRQMLINLGMPRMKEIFAIRAAAYKARFANNLFKGCNTYEDYLHAYKVLLYCNDVKDMMSHALKNLWGGSIAETEKIVMDLLCLKYVNVLVSGEEPKTRRSGGSIRSVLNRAKGTRFNDPIR